MVNNSKISSKNLAYIAFGSNIFATKDSLMKEIPALVEEVNGDNILIQSKSSFYQTPAFPKGSGPDYINAAFSLQTNLSPQDLLTRLHEVEAKFGRTRNKRWEARVLDLDLLFYNDEVLPDAKTWQFWADLTTEQASKITPEQLILPHPRLHERAFVLKPLLDLAPNLHHPVLRKSIKELWDNLPKADRDEIIAQ